MGMITEDLYYAGAVKFKDITVNAGAITDTSIKTNAGIAASKLQHEHRIHYSQPNTTATSEAKAVYRCRGATGTILNIEAGSIGACAGSATITVDVKKNGTTVLASAIVLDSGNVAYTAESGSVSVEDMVAGDVLTVHATAAAGSGTLGTGLYVSISVNEDAA
jgi:hypothetical protein